MFMGLLNVLVFCLPAKSGERVSFAMTVLLAIAVFLTLVGDNMPKTSEPMSTICYFLLTNLVLSSLIMIVTIFNLGIYYRSETIPIPRWLTNLVLVLKCKSRPKSTQVKQIAEDGEDIPENSAKDIKEQIKWALPALQSAEDEKYKVTWRDVSKMVDVIAGSVSFIWLLLTAASFFVMVVTHHVPGAKNN
jgi:hypothetical protein